MKLSSILKDYPVLSVSDRPIAEAFLSGQMEQQIHSIDYDSRRVSAGSLFFCLPGAHADGHRFAPLAYAAGCRAFVCSRRLVSLPEDAVQILVENPRHALACLSASFYGRPAENLTVIGITGTKGKTTTAFFLREILSGCGFPCAYVGSNGVLMEKDWFDTVNTTPESSELHRYFRMMVDRGITHVVMEVSSQALATHRVEGVRFDTCLFTNLADDHIGEVEHPSFAAYRAAKARLFRDFAPEHIVCNLDDSHWRAVIGNPGENTDFIGFSLHQPLSDHCRFTAAETRPFRGKAALGIDFTCVSQGGNTAVRLCAPGELSVYNGLGAIAAVSIYGVSAADAAQILQTLSVPGRFEVVDALPGVTFVLDYAHNGFSLENALQALSDAGQKSAAKSWVRRLENTPISQSLRQTIRTLKIPMRSTGRFCPTTIKRSPICFLRIEKTPFVQQYTWQRQVTSFSAPERVTKPIS